MRPYAQLVADEQKKFYRILTFLFCGLQMAALADRFSHHWSHMEPVNHWTAIAYLASYPTIAIFSVRKNADPVLIAFLAYVLLGMMIVSPVFS
jgi:hypothetical protein